MEGWHWLLLIVAVVVIGVIIWRMLKTPRPLVMKEFESVATSGTLPDDPTAGGVDICVGMTKHDAGAVVASITHDEAEVIREDVGLIDNMSEDRKKTALGLVLLFNSQDTIEYPPQTVTIKGKDWSGNSVVVHVNVPKQEGKDGENAFFYIAKNGDLYWAHSKRSRAAKPDLTWEEARKEIKA